jgi:lipoyl(octanoyl) transferase
VDSPTVRLPLDAACHVLPHIVASGPANMALDEALLEWVAGGGAVACLRTYGWTTPTLSLGYFQRLAEIQTDPRFQTVPLVRRLTGGGAIWHHHEVTYALVVAGNHPLARPSTGLYRAVHAAIAEALGAVGLAAVRRGDGGSGYGDQKRPVLCFIDTDQEDIVAGNAKIVGSAQRRREGAVLQHGSLLLARSFLTPELQGVCDMADEAARGQDWPEQLRARIPPALGLRRVDVPVSVQARALASDLEFTRYQNPAWTGLR